MQRLNLTHPPMPTGIEDPDAIRGEDGEVIIADNVFDLPGDTFDWKHAASHLLPYVKLWQGRDYAVKQGVTYGARKVLYMVTLFPYKISPHMYRL